ncbi:MAG: ribosomal RNA small subunit methyltransferase A [Cytophagales bacterium]|nr:ribosomal RNA small subunit methyltransferase A [Cytophagales bacterium]
MVVRPKKHLGQHFLIDERVSEEIVNALDIEGMSIVYEVGPGTGVLTKRILELPCSFEALDVDVESINFLKNNYPDHAEKFIIKDFLRTDILKDRVAIIGNFPYNISSQLLFKVWDERSKVDHVVCMLQKEVAERVASKHGNKVYGILSVLLQAFYDIEYLFPVPPEAFNPPPKVQSAVIRLMRNDVDHLPCGEKLFKRVVKTAFGKRRKTLRNALKELDLPAEFTGERLFDLRAEQLSVSDFVALTTRIEKWMQSSNLN